MPTTAYFVDGLSPIVRCRFVVRLRTMYKWEGLILWNKKWLTVLMKLSQRYRCDFVKSKYISRFGHNLKIKYRQMSKIGQYIAVVYRIDIIMIKFNHW